MSGRERGDRRAGARSVAGRLVPILLHSAVSTAIGALVAVLTTIAVLYPLALHDWGNESRNIRSVAAFYESGHAEAVREERTTRHPSEYLRVHATDLSFRGPDATAECVTRLSDVDGPLGDGAQLLPSPSAIGRVCHGRVTVVSRFGRDDALFAVVPVTDNDGDLVGVRVQTTERSPRPTVLSAILETRALVVLGAVAVLVGSIGLLAGRLGRAHLDEVNRIASIDGLTGVLRREALLAAAEAAVRKARRRGSNLSVLAVDVDWLKQINDRFGHSGGDAALTLVASSLRSALRDGDLIGRTGGDEFVALLPGADASTAEAVAARLGSATSVVHLALKGELAPLSVSVGTATLRKGDDTASLLERADASLYEAKRRRGTVDDRERRPADTIGVG